MFRIRTKHFSLRFMLLAMAVVCGTAAYAAYQLRQDLPLPIGWDRSTGENVKWSVTLGSQTFSNPTIHGNFVLIGTNNEGGFDPLIPKKVDLGVLLCFEKATGELLWQHSNRKLKTGRIQDWPAQGVTSQAFADGDRVWYLNNRCEVVCLDMQGFRDQENDGPFKEEPASRDIDADVIWKVSLIDRFDVFPHNLSHCNVVVDDHRVYVKTCNGVNETHLELPSPEAPSFVVLDRNHGGTIWTDNTPARNIWHGSWGSPRLATIAEKDQILFPGGDGWLYSFEPAGDGTGNSKLLWKFDGNPKTAIYKPGGIGTRNISLTAPTVYRDKVYFTLGQDPEHGSGASRVWCIAPGNRRGDLSPTLVQRGTQSPAPGFENGFRFCVSETGDKEIPNPNSALVWEYTGIDKNQDGQLDNADIRMDRSLSEVRVVAGLACVTDVNGFFHCLDAETGQLCWAYDAFATLWTSPLVNKKHIYLFDEDGMVSVFRTNRDPTIAMPAGTPVAQMDMHYPIQTNATVDQGVIYFATRNSLWAIEAPQNRNQMQKWLR